MNSVAHEMVIGRCFGIGLFGLVFACWPDTQKSVSSTAAFRGMLIFNALIAAYQPGSPPDQSPRSSCRRARMSAVTIAPRP